MHIAKTFISAYCNKARYALTLIPLAPQLPNTSVGKSRFRAKRTTNEQQPINQPWHLIHPKRQLNHPQTQIRHPIALPDPPLMLGVSRRRRIPSGCSIVPIQLLTINIYSQQYVMLNMLILPPIGDLLRPLSFRHQ